MGPRMVISIMIEEKIIFLERFKVLNEKLRKITEEVDNFVKEEQGSLNREVVKNPSLVLKLMKRGKKEDWKLF